MKTKLSTQASVVNAHIAGRLIDDPGFQSKINLLNQSPELSAQQWLTGYINNNFKDMANTESISTELIQAWSVSPEGDTCTKVKSLVRKSRSTFALGFVAFTGAVVGVGFMFSAAMDNFLHALIMSLL